MEIVSIKNKAVFLDRDGTICEESHYLSDPAELRVYPFSADAINILRGSGFKIVIITNQSGIGRGYFNQASLELIHGELKAQLECGGAEVDAIYFCPHNPEDACTCRKPLPGMILQASRDLEIDLDGSWMIGDKLVDIQAGVSAGTRSGLVLTGYGEAERARAENLIDLVAPDLLSMAKLIVEIYGSPKRKKL